MTDMADMTRAEILDIWKGFVRNMSDQGAVVPFAHEIARRVRNEMLARLEAAEKERNDVAQQLVQSEVGKRSISEECDALRADRATLQQMTYHLKDRLEADEKEVDALRAKIEAIEQQEPAAWLHESRRDSDVVTNAVKHVWGKAAVGSMAAYSIPLYALPGAKGEEE